ncbi:MAG: hypothetical protein K1X51_07555 [Rhodospirillaceae bacterium]|nr:hypothetical protein [Rhodospirillaceae bacterium]
MKIAKLLFTVVNWNVVAPGPIILRLYRRVVTTTSVSLPLITVCLVSSFAWANQITQVEGKFVCPGVNNLQECAIQHEKVFLQKNKALAVRDESGWKVKLLDGQDFRIADEDRRYNLLELAAGGRFLAIRQQWYEGNTWQLLDRKTGVLTQISGYPLFSPSMTRFVAASEDLDAQYSATVLDVYGIDANGVKLEFQGITGEHPAWAPRKVKWRSETIVDFHQATLTQATGDYQERPASLQLTASGWQIRSSR